MKINKIVQRPLAWVSLTILLSASVAAAQTYQYNVFVKGFKGPAKNPNGEVIVNPDEDPDDTGEAQRASLTLVPASLSFDAPVTTEALSAVGVAQDPETSSQSGTDIKTVTLKNRGTAPAVLFDIPSTGSFAISTTCTNLLGPGQTCEISAQYRNPLTPESSFSEIATVQAVGLQAIPLVLQAVVPKKPSPSLVFKPDSLVFGDMTPGIPATMSSTLRNKGTTSAVISGLSDVPGYGVVSTCPPELAAGAECEVTATFKESNTGSQYRSVVIPYRLVDPAMLPLSGVVLKEGGGFGGIEEFVISPSELNFGPDAQSLASLQTATFTNGTKKTVVLPNLTGTTGFSINTTCAAELLPNSSCELQVSYTGAASTHKAITVTGSVGEGTTQAPYAKSLMLLAGVSVTKYEAELQFKPQKISFDVVPVGQTASQRTVLTNKGNSAASLRNFFFDVNSPALSQTNDCPETLQPGVSCNIDISYSAAETGLESVFIVSQVTDAESFLRVTATPLYAKIATKSALDFGLYSSQTLPALRPLVVSNLGTGPLSGLKITQLTGPYSIDKSLCSSVLQAKESCTIQLAGNFASSGNQEGLLSLASDNGGEAQVQLSGSFTNSKLEVSTDFVPFPETAVGVTSAPETFTLINKGTDVATITGISMLAGEQEFNQSNNCSTTLAAGQSCGVNTSFTPNAEKTRTGALVIGSAGSKPLSVSLQGEGYANKLLLAPSVVKFSTISMGEPSSSASIVVSNPSAVAAQITGISIFDGEERYAQSNNCSTALDAGVSCQIDLLMNSSIGGAISGKLAIQTSFGDYTATLNGKVLTPKTVITGPDGAELTPGTAYDISFPNTAVGTQATARTATLKNSGDGVLKIKSSALTAPSDDFKVSRNCGSELGAGASCDIVFDYKPIANGKDVAVALVGTNAGDFTFNITGTGVSVRGAWAAQTTSDFGKTFPEKPSQRGFSFKNTGTEQLELGANVTGEGVSLVAGTCGTSAAKVVLKAGASCSVLLAYNPATVSSVLTNGVLLANISQLKEPVVQALTGQGTAYNIEFQDTASADYGALVAGTSTQKVFVLKNVSGLADTIADLPRVSGDFAIKSSTCVAGIALKVGGTCTVTVLANAPGVSGSDLQDMGGTLVVSTVNGAVGELSLKAISANNTGILTYSNNGDFGELLPGDSVTHTITLTNYTKFPVTVSGQPHRTGTGTGFAGNSVPCANKLLNPGIGCSISMTVTAPAGSDPGKYTLSDLITASSTTGAVVDMPLTARYTQTEYTMSWGDDFYYGTLAVGKTASRVFILTNTGTTPITLATGAKRVGTSTGFSGTSNGCTAGKVLPAGGTCSVVMVATGKAGPMFDTMTVSNTKGVTASVNMSAN